MNDRLRQALREVMSAKGWNQDRAAAEFHLTQQGISKFLSRKTGASIQFAWDIARARGVSLDSLLASEGQQHSAPPLGQLEAWRLHEPAARAMYRHVSQRAFEAVASWCVEPPPEITPVVIGSFAEAWWKGEIPRDSVGPERPAPAAEDSRGFRRTRVG